MGCVVLAEHLRAVAWPPKFLPHLPEKYDGTTNPSKFLQVYITVITAAGGNDAVMASYFHVALTRPARTWLMNLSPGSIQSWGELCALFSANFASAYQQHGVETHLHAVRQQPGESLRAFISCFTKVRGTIPSISDASIITAFRQGIRDEKMLEKLATHQVETVATLFALADKCARAAEGPCMALGPSRYARGPELARQAPASARWRQRVMLSQLVIKQVWGEHSFNKSQLAAYLTHMRKPAPAKSRLRSQQAHSGGKPTPVVPSSLRRKAHSGRTKPTLVALSDVKPTPVAVPTLHLCKSYP